MRASLLALAKSIYYIYRTTVQSSGGSRPSDKGGGTGHPHPEIRGARSPKKFFSVLRASFWSKNKGGPGPPGPLPWIHQCKGMQSSKLGM